MKLILSPFSLVALLAIGTTTTITNTHAFSIRTITSSPSTSSVQSAIVQSSLHRPNTRNTHLHASKQETTTATTTTTSPQIKLYNSLSNSKQSLETLKPQSVSMYTCGPTVYDYAHVGNFRAFLTYDVLKRTLLYFGYDVHHVCNLTDVDDKIIAKCTRDDISLLELTRKFEGLFMDDLHALNIIPAREYPRATDHIEEMVTLIQDLEGQGLAYQSEEGSWYFAVEKKEGYGQQLVKLDVKNMKANASGVAGAQRSSQSDNDNQENTNSDDDEEEEEDDLDADEYDADKVGARDFALWKAYKPKFDRQDATWDTSIGKGRPGWHLECSAMARKYLGDTIDIHCGGIDLKFPHHENEIAQSEGASGKKFCNYWVHNGFVNIGEEKMSKSKGNFLTLRGACPTNDDIRAYRYLVVSSQYRNPLSFTKVATGAAKGALKRMDNVMNMLNDALKEFDNADGNGDSDSSGEIAQTVSKELNNFELALMDDLSMPRAAASLFGIIKAAETEFKRYKKAEKDAEDGTDIPPLDLVGLSQVRSAITKMDQVFGIFYQVPKAKNEDGTEVDDGLEEEGAPVPEEVMDLVRSRSDAKNDKDWDLADSLRKRISELGYAVKDVKGGEPIVSRVG